MGLFGLQRSILKSSIFYAANYFFFLFFISYCFEYIKLIIKKSILFSFFLKYSISHFQSETGYGFS